MKIFKYISAAALAAGLCARLCAQNENQVSVFSQTFGNYYFMNPVQALEAYIGNWSGSQALSVGGKEVATAVVQQHFVPSRGISGDRIVGTGKIIGMGASIPIRSYMYVQNGTLFLDIQTADGRIVPYVGSIEYNNVTWVPKYFFMAYDLQTDTFFKTADGARMETTGSKYVRFEQNHFEGFLDIQMVLTRENAAKPADRVNSSKTAKFVFPQVGAKE